jgi:Asp-tRNA(Asn)/Glu-tRNA(Gln) amidotransferase C subunit
MSAWTNVSIERDSAVNQRRRIALLEAELAFWKEHADRLQQTLENIPAAVEKWGEVDIKSDGVRVTLIAKPAHDPSPPPARGRDDADG